MPQRHFVLTREFANTRSSSFSEGLSVFFAVRRRRVSPERGPDRRFASTFARYDGISVRTMQGIIQALFRWPTRIGLSDGLWNWTLNHPSPGADAVRLTRNVSFDPARGIAEGFTNGKRNESGRTNSPKRRLFPVDIGPPVAKLSPDFSRRAGCRVRRWSQPQGSNDAHDLLTGPNAIAVAIKDVVSRTTTTPTSAAA